MRWVVSAGVAAIALATTAVAQSVRVTESIEVLEARAAFAEFVARAPARYERQIATARQRLTELQ